MLLLFIFWIICVCVCVSLQEDLRPRPDILRARGTRQPGGGDGLPPLLL